MIPPFGPLAHPSLGHQLRSALGSSATRLPLGTYDSVDVTVYPEHPGGRQSTLACLRGDGGQAFVDSAHYASWKSFAAAVAFTVKYLRRAA